MEKNHLIEKVNYPYEQLVEEITPTRTLQLQDLVKTNLDGHLFTLFINHTLVVRDVENIMFIFHEDDNFIHGIVDVYDRVLREKMFNSTEPEGEVRQIKNDHLADIVIQSDIVINVQQLGVYNFIQRTSDDMAALKNEYLIEIYTDWHTQFHFKENEFFRLFFE